MLNNNIDNNDKNDNNDHYNNDDKDIKKNKRQKKCYIVQLDGKDTSHVYYNYIPSDAARKAANKGYKTILLRERNTNKFYKYIRTGFTKRQVELPNGKKTFIKAIIKPIPLNE